MIGKHQQERKKGERDKEIETERERQRDGEREAVRVVQPFFFYSTELLFFSPHCAKEPFISASIPHSPAEPAWQSLHNYYSRKSERRGAGEQERKSYTEREGARERPSSSNGLTCV